MVLLGVPAPPDPGAVVDRQLSPPAERRPTVDRRLFRIGRTARPFLAAAVLLGIAGAALAIARAVLLARVIAGAFDGAEPRTLADPLAALLGVAIASALVAWLTEAAAHHSAAGVKSALRRALLRSVADREGAGERAGALAAAAGRGIEALDGYFARYLPQLALAVLVPVFVVAWMFPLDPLAGVIVLVTLPLIPLFAALVGAATRARVARRWQAFSDLSSGFVEALRALPTLKVFGRSREQVAAFAALSDRHRRETMGTLRIAFLSAFVLELAATISVAVVAVAVGLRVLDGGLGLEAGLTVLILAPEAYLPPRRLAAEFHAAAEGVEAAAEILDTVDAPAGRAAAGGATPAPARPAPITIEGLTVVYPGRTGPALERLCVQIEEGEYLAVAGPSGSGKSTLLGVLLCLVETIEGRVSVAGLDLASLDVADWRRLVGWLPQQPLLFHGTIAENVRFGANGASEQDVRQALIAAAAGFVDDLPDGTGTLVGEGGARLSAGERSRIALARALLRRPPLLLLDEPTAHLDPITELAVLDSLDELRGSTTIILAGHRRAAPARADRVLWLEAGRPVLDRGEL
jgi:ATP-binding cassette subfamily C protein CydCD